MAAEVLAALKPQPDGRYADGTLGGAGHAARNSGREFADWMAVWVRSRWRRG